jgi:hypothetical protein
VPFALHAKRSKANVENEVVALAIRKRLIDTDSKPDRRSRDLGLGDRTLLVGRKLHDRELSLPIGQR